MNPVPNSQSLAEWAAYYGRYGWRIFPCKPHSKDPATLHGFKDATTDAARIAAWWRVNPEYNIAFAVPSGMIVVDVDCKPGWDGRKWAAEHAALLPPTIKQQTGGGGYQLFYLAPTENLMQRSLAPGVDVRIGGKGYVLLPPSIHPNGEPYHWWEGQGPDERAIR